MTTKQRWHFNSALYKREKMKLILRILALIALLISLIWLYFERDFEPALTSVVSLSALISTFVFSKVNKKQNNNEQHQTVGNKSNAIQASGDVNISIGNNSKKDD